MDDLVLPEILPLGPDSHQDLKGANLVPITQEVILTPNLRAGENTKAIDAGRSRTLPQLLPQSEISPDTTALDKSKIETLACGEPANDESGSNERQTEQPLENVSSNNNQAQEEQDTQIIKEMPSPQTSPVADKKDKTPGQLPDIPKVRKTNFEGFKNFYSEDDGRHAIDVLVAGNNLKNEILHELVRRERRDFRSRGGREWNEQMNQNGGAIESEEDNWIQWVRIRSKPILAHLAKIVGEVWSLDTPRIFSRPFSVFIYFQPMMKEVLEHLEKDWAAAALGDARTEDTDEGVTEGKTGDVVEDEEEEEETQKASESDSANGILYSVEALKDMRCYVKFVDDEIMPLFDLYRDGTRRKIRFDDLWLLFRVGELVYASPEIGFPATNDSEPLGPVYQSLWRVYSIVREEDPFDHPSLKATSKPRKSISQDDDDDDDDKDENVSKNQLSVWCYYIDHDGTSYGAVKRGFKISRYEGEKDISQLPCFPVTFLDDSQHYLDELEAQGRTFQQYIKSKHLYYNGWTLVSKPDGPLVSSPSSAEKKLQSPEYIDSQVIVDFTEAFHEMSSWKPKFHLPGVYSDAWSSGYDTITTKRWSDSRRLKFICNIQETVQKLDGVNMWQRKDGLEKNQFFKSITKGQSTIGDKSATTLNVDDVKLLPKRLFAYVLRDRRWALVDIQSLSEIQPQPDIFDSLRIDDGYKEMVKGLVASHFTKKDLEKKFAGNFILGQSQDIIQGKGRGLVILLHGVPGVGKTATAEAVAFEYKKPLFVITCGDLGLTPREVEESLTEIFRLAHLWDCVLLLDEADVFLGQRSRLDLKRNALVSVFLRILEYYNGVLFLTTNRVGTLDEAFKSRIHMSLYYPPLNKKQVTEIFSMSINKLDKIEGERHALTKEPKLDIKEANLLKFAENHCEKTREAGGRWNGRQIRNAFQIASSLARYQVLVDHAVQLRQNPDAVQATPVLDDEQFNKVERATEAFNKYMKETLGYNDADIAYLHQERADHLLPSKLLPNVNRPVSSTHTAAYAQSQPQYSGVNLAAGSIQQGQGQFGISQQDCSGMSGMQFPASQPGPMQYGLPGVVAQHPGLGQDSPRAFLTPTHYGAGLNSFSTPPRGQAADPFQGSQTEAYGQPRQGFTSGAPQNPGHYTQQNNEDPNRYL